MTRTHDTDVLIIGGGATGAGLMRDLALRGIAATLIDRRDLNAGASGGNHGLLHSGGRYAATDTETAAECRREGEILKRVAPQCIDDCGGLFVAVEGDDPGFAGRFPEACAAAGISCEKLTPDEARAREPALPETVIAAYAVPDATIDPFRLVLEQVSHAEALMGSRYLPHTGIEGFDIAGGKITAARARDLKSGEEIRITARQVVNASGAWSGKVAALAGCDSVHVTASKGTLIISNTRLAKGVINRLRPPGDGDILVPGGTVSILGTSSVTIADPDDRAPTIE
ncbi:MAG: FAD-dependent oxidoreductase, partial [Maritimibacter sp.]|nr:FAD-dependent oxidoreductase [Maritimibacter sp.]